jgi:spore coat polysaccharide biosynthesis protein SpsF
MGSSRLPGKVLADVAGAPALSRLLARLRRCRLLDGVVLATSTSPTDDALEDWARAAGVAVHRGSEEDVLQRVVDAQRAAGGEIAVEITGDCVLTDPEVVDLGVETFLVNDCDVVSNCGRTLTWPMGLYVQVFPVALLEEVAAKVPDPAVREHVSLYFYEHPERYRLIEILAPPRWRVPEQRLQLDYPEDLALLTAIYRELEPVHGEAFGVEEILALLRRRPDLAALNRHCTERAAR